MSEKEIQSKIDNLNKPKGSLGRLESLALQICMVQQTLTPRLTHPCHILFGGDHGILREGVSPTPRDVTWQQMLNYGRGGGGVNMFCRQHGFELRVVDVGVDYDFDPETDSHIINRKIAHGTRNFLYEPAMTQEEWERALAVGAEQVDICYEKGCNIICFGEMGAGNTSPSSIIMHLLTGIPLEKCVGAGSGLDSEGVKHKLEVLRKAVKDLPPTPPVREGSSSYSCGMKVCRPHYSKVYTPLPTREGQGGGSAVFPYYMGYEMAAATGAMLRAAEHRMLILVDGFIMSACMLAAREMMPSVMDFAIFGHCGDEGGHKLMLEAMGAKPLLNLGMRLGEGTGALCAYPIVQSAVNMINEMDNFNHAQITKYF